MIIRLINDLKQLEEEGIKIYNVYITWDDLEEKELNYIIDSSISGVIQLGNIHHIDITDYVIYSIKHNDMEYLKYRLDDLISELIYSI